MFLNADEVVKIGTPFEVYRYAKTLGTRFEQGEAKIAYEPICAWFYIRDVVKHAMPGTLIEKAIAQDKQSTYCYALNMAKGRFELGEEVLAGDVDLYRGYIEENIHKLLRTRKITQDEYCSILGKNAVLAYEYAKRHGKRFKEGELVIAGRAEFAVKYAKLFKFRFVPGEAAISRDALASFEYLKFVKKCLKIELDAALKFKMESMIATNVDMSLDYSWFLKDRFELGERIIAKVPRDAYNYICNIKQSLPGSLIEQSIAKSKKYSILYAMNIVKGRFKLGEPVIFGNPRTALIYKAFLEKAWRDAPITS